MCEALPPECDSRKLCLSSGIACGLANGMSADVCAEDTCLLCLNRVASSGFSEQAASARSGLGVGSRQKFCRSEAAAAEEAMACKPGISLLVNPSKSRKAAANGTDDVHEEGLGGRSKKGRLIR